MTSRSLILAAYVAVAVAALALETSARRRSEGGGTFGAAVGSGLRHRPVRLLLLAGWLWLGWHLFVRVDWR
jgi:hypothetical protein